MYIQYPLSHTQSQYTSYALQYATHKPERAVTPATAHSGTYIHTNPSVEQLQQQLTQAHIYTQTLSVELPQQQLTQAHIHTNPSVEQLQQQLTQVHIYTQTQAWNNSSNSSLRYIYTHKPKRGTAPATAHSGTHKHINTHNTHIHNCTDIYKQP